MYSQRNSVGTDSTVLTFLIPKNDSITFSWLLKFLILKKDCMIFLHLLRFLTLKQDFITPLRLLKVLFLKNYSITFLWLLKFYKKAILYAAFEGRLSYHIYINKLDLLCNFIALGTHFLIGTKFSWKEGIDIVLISNVCYLVVVVIFLVVTWWLLLAN